MGTPLTKRSLEVLQRFFTSNSELRQSYAAEVVRLEQFRLFNQQRGLSLLADWDIMGPNAPKVAKEQHHFTELLALQPSPFSTDYTPETSTPLSALWDSQLKQEQESIITTNEHPMMRFLTPGDDPAHIARLHLDKANMPYGDVAFIGNRSLVAQRNFDAIKAATEQKQWSLDVHVEEIQQTVDQSQRKPGVR